MAPSKCALCRKFGYKRRKDEKVTDNDMVWNFEKKFEELPKECAKSFLQSIRGKPVHPSCWELIAEMENEFDICKCEIVYIKTPILDVDYDSDSPHCKCDCHGDECYTARWSTIEKIKDEESKRKRKRRKIRCSLFDSDDDDEPKTKVSVQD